MEGKEYEFEVAADVNDSGTLVYGPSSPTALALLGDEGKCSSTLLRCLRQIMSSWHSMYIISCLQVFLSSSSPFSLLFYAPVLSKRLARCSNMQRYKGVQYDGSISLENGTNGL